MKVVDISLVLTLCFVFPNSENVFLPEPVNGEQFVTDGAKAKNCFGNCSIKFTFFSYIV